MKKLFGALLAATVIAAVGSPALAHPDDDDDNAAGSYGQYFGGYQNFDARYQHDWQGIQHGLSDGSYTPREARYFALELQRIRQREAYFRSGDGWLNPQEGRDIQIRLERLHEIMHQAHDDGHAAQDDWNGASRSYRGYNGFDEYNGYGTYYRRR